MFGLIEDDEVPAAVRPLAGTHGSARPRARWRWLALAGGALLATFFMVWWRSTAIDREIQALPDGRRIPLYQRTLQNLKSVCDPAAPRSLSEFCHDEADLVLRFRECDRDPQCQELARRHIFKGDR